MFIVLVYKDGDAYEYRYDNLEEAIARRNENPEHSTIEYPHHHRLA